MKYQTKLPQDVREVCAGHARGYERQKWMLARRRAELCQSGRPEAGALGLAALEESEESRSVRAVERAMGQALSDIGNREIRGALESGILRNLENRRLWPYERLYLPCVGKKLFYRKKNLFLLALARELGYRGE